MNLKHGQTSKSGCLKQFILLSRLLEFLNLNNHQNLEELFKIQFPGSIKIYTINPKEVRREYGIDDLPDLKIIIKSELWKKKIL